MWSMVSALLRFLDHTQRRAKVGRSPLDERSVCHRDLYLTTHNTHNRETSVPPAGSKPQSQAGEMPQTYALDRATTGTGNMQVMKLNISSFYTFIPLHIN